MSTSNRQAGHEPSPSAGAAAVARTAITRTAAVARPSSPRINARNSCSGTSIVASPARSADWPPSIGVTKTCSGPAAGPPSSSAARSAVVGLSTASRRISGRPPGDAPAVKLEKKRPLTAHARAAREAHQAALAIPSKGATIQSAATPASRQIRIAPRSRMRATSMVPKPTSRAATTAAANRMRACTTTTRTSPPADPRGTTRGTSGTMR